MLSHGGNSDVLRLSCWVEWKCGEIFFYESNVMTLPDFLEQDAEGWMHFSGHRVGLESVVFLYNQGYSAEMLWSEYPTLPLATIHRAIAFYLEQRSDVDKYIATCDREVAQHRAAAPSTPTLAELRSRVEAARGVESA